LDQCLSGDYMEEEIEEAEVYHKTLEDIFDNTQQSDPSTAYLNKYVVDTFGCFVRNKTTFEIAFIYLKYGFVAESSLLDIFLFKRSVIEDWDPIKFKRREEEDYSNLIKPETLKIFANVTDIILYTSDAWGEMCWTLSFIALLSLIKNTNVKRVIVEAWGRSYKSWLYLVWNGFSEDIIKKYQQQKFEVKYQQEIDDCGRTIDKIMIDKI